MMGTDNTPWLIDVCVIGAQKAGSSSMAQWLADHPGICHSRIKETHFWAGEPLGREKPTEREIAQWFDEQFGGARPGQLLVDSSTSYSMFPEFAGVVERLHGHNPKMRLIYVLRDPVARIESHLAHSYRNGVIDSVGMREIDADPTFIERSSYHLQITRYLERFATDQVHVVALEDLKRDPVPELEATADFLGIDCYDMQLPRKNVSASRTGVTSMEAALRRRGVDLPVRIREPLRRRWGRQPARPLNPDERDELRRRLADDRGALESLLGRDMPWDR